MREAPSLVLIDELLSRGAQVVAYDPEATETARAVLGERIAFAESAASAADGVDAIILVTEWNEFRNPDWRALRDSVRQTVFFDGRNLYDPKVVRESGWTYHAIGRA
jgi:UDPglucose 6-dehydrogenase